MSTVVAAKNLCGVCKPIRRVFGLNNGLLAPRYSILGIVAGCKFAAVVSLPFPLLFAGWCFDADLDALGRYRLVTDR